VELYTSEPADAETIAHLPASTVVLPGFNHMFQKATSGAIGEYVQIEVTVDPEALAVMGDWLAEALQPLPAPGRRR
jgi:hypothetical protein